jgi:hypothetical protein
MPLTYRARIQGTLGHKEKEIVEEEKRSYKESLAPW